MNLLRLLRQNIYRASEEREIDGKSMEDVPLTSHTNPTQLSCGRYQQSTQVMGADIGGDLTPSWAQPAGDLREDVDKLFWPANGGLLQSSRGGTQLLLDLLVRCPVYGMPIIYILPTWPTEYSLSK